MNITCMLKLVCFVEVIFAGTLLLISICCQQMQNLETDVRPYLNQWYEESVMHIHRVVQLLQANVGYLLHAVRNH